jgi:dihydrofolate reductase
MAISIIVATDEDGAIGKDNAIPWHVPADLAYFRTTTRGHPIIMGRLTYQSIGRPLPGRLNIVVTRDTGFRAEGIKTAASIEEALDIAKSETDGEIFVIGGAEIYQLGLSHADRIYLTEIHTRSGGDRFFKYDPQQWREISRESHKADENNDFDYDFLLLERAGDHLVQ